MSFDNSTEEEGEAKEAGRGVETQVRARRVTKVDDLLRRSQTNAFQMNKEDLDQLYNLEVPGLKARQGDDFSSEMDEKSKAYLYKVQELREKQRNLLPLFLQSKRIVQRHKRCLSTILSENEEHLPYQLQTVIDKGLGGLKSYSDLLENVDQVLKKNQDLTDQL